MDVPNTQKAAPAVEISELRFAWHDGRNPVLVIERLQIESGERVFIEGPSGSGKSTLLSLVAGIVIPQKGTIKVNGVHLNALSGAHRDRFRADHIGFIYQLFNLIPYLSVVENVTLPCRFSTRKRQRAAERHSDVKGAALHLLTTLGMDNAAVIRQPVTQLSVGQQQRVAAARALIGEPDLIIADEPTSSLDADRREAFIRLVFNECRQQETTLIFVSHDMGLESLFDRTVRLADINAV
jgi:putative ABC transport system ATP-binding protein